MVTARDAGTPSPAKPAIDTTAARLVDAVITVTEQHTVVYANPAVRRIIGCGPQDLLGRSILELTPPSVRAACSRRFREYIEVIRSGTEIDAFEFPAVRQDGRECVLEMALGPHTTEGRLLLTGVLRDVTAQKHRAAALHATAQRDRQLFDQNVVGVFRLGFDGRLLEVNVAMARILGYSREELVGMAAIDFYFDAEDREEWIGSLLEHGLLANHVHRLRRRDGSEVWTLESSQIVDDPVTGSKCVLGTAIDISERKATEDRLQHYAYHDPLTGLANRRMLKDTGDRAIAQCERNHDRVAMLYIDLMRFKRINDTLGHAAGDQVICEVAERLRGVSRASDTLARVGGDEFVLFLAPARTLADALGPADRVRDRLAAPMLVAGESLHIDARIGAALYPEHGTSFDELLSNADLASHQAGANEAETSVFKPPVGPDRGRSHLVLEEDLRRALNERQLVLHYQPIFRLADGVAVGAESLARWPLPDGRLMCGEEFIPVAEHTGLIRRIDRWTLHESLDQLNVWAQTGVPFYVSINLTPCAFDDPDLPEHVKEALDAHGMTGGRLVAEVTERISMRDPRRGERILRGLKDLGIRVIIDDFGRGQSSIAYLRDFPVDGLKIDLSFTTRIGTDRHTERLVEGMLALSDGLGIDVIAEGIETEHQLRWLTERGCGFGQGYHLYRPSPADVVTKAFSNSEAIVASATVTDRTTAEQKDRRSQ